MTEQGSAPAPAFPPDVQEAVRDQKNQVDVQAVGPLFKIAFLTLSAMTALLIAAHVSVGLLAPENEITKGLAATLGDAWKATLGGLTGLLVGKAT